MELEKSWYAVYTKPRWEKKVAETLTKKRIDNFCPLNRVVKQWADRKKLVHEPLFPNYVFVHTTESEFISVKQTSGILHIVYWLGKPAVIRIEEIEAIKDFLRDYTDVKLEKIKININDKVRIVSGPLMSLEGNVMDVNKRTVKVYLPSMGYALITEMDKLKVEVVNPQASKRIGNQNKSKLAY